MTTKGTYTYNYIVTWSPHYKITHLFSGHGYRMAIAVKLILSFHGF